MKLSMDWLKSLETKLIETQNISAMGKLHQLYNLVKEDSQTPMIGNAGLLKAGKSTLFNALSNCDEKFPTGSARKTVKNQSEEMGNYIFCDTPGIDAKVEDSVEAEKTFQKSDLILLVHNINMGEYDALEIDLLKRLEEFFPEKSDFQKRVIPVFSNIDLKSEDEITMIIQKIQNQWDQTIGFRFEHAWEVSAKRYLTGKKKNSELLMEKSNIPQFKLFIEAELPRLKEQRNQLKSKRINKGLNTILNDLQQQRDVIHEKIKQKEFDLSQQKQWVLEDFQRVQKNIKKKFRNYQSI